MSPNLGSARKRRGTRLFAAAAAVVALVLSLLVAIPSADAQANGFRISGRNLLDANGNNFIMRGTSHPHVWFQGETASYGEIAGLGANAVRVVLGSGHRGWGTSSATDVANVINLCKQNRLICMLEVHDTTGFGEQGGAASLDQAVTYWDSIRSALIGQEAFILINIGNEPIGNNNPAQWTTATANAVQRMRTLGFTHTLVVDAPNWGQDWTNTMRSNAMTVWNADSLRNTLFSVHMYEVYGTASAITTYFDAFAQLGLPLVVGEFGNMHNGQEVDEGTIMAEAQARGIGWLAWSYSGNSGGTEFLDQTVQFNPNQLTTWGQRVFTGANGVQATAECATVFTGCGPASTSPPPSSPPPSSPPPSSPPPSSPPGPGGCTSTGTVQNQWQNGYVVQPVTVTNTGTASISGWQVGFTLPSGHSVVGSWNAQFSGTSGAINAVNMGYNGSLAPGASTSFGFQSSRPNGNTQTPTGYTCTVR